jgi:hypothetical protein
VKIRKSIIWAVVFMVVVVGLVACGGSGGGDGNTAGNTAPVAEAGPDQSILTSSSVTLNGSGSSDANGDTLTYNWSFTSKPAGSTATLSSSTVSAPTFTADLAGSYILSLVVNDGQVSSGTDTVTIIAVNPAQDVQFEQFEYRFAAGPCLPDDDCFGFIVLASDGTLLNDKFRELPAGTVHTAKVTQAELDAAIPVLTETSLVELLDLPGQICEPPTDIFEDMILTMEGKTHSHTVTWCGDQPIVDARQVLNDLANRYFP